MTDFRFANDFPKSKFELNQRFLDPKPCYDHLFK